MHRRQLRSRFVFAASALGLAVCVPLGLLAWRPLYVQWQIRSAREALRLGDGDDVRSALRALQAAERVERPDRPELLYLLARAHRRAGHLEQAFAYLKRAEQAGWSADEVAQQFRLALVQRARFAETERYLQRLLSRGADDELAYEVYEALAKGYLHAYRFHDALHCLNFWIAWCPDATDPRMWRAGIWEQVERWTPANDEYRAILQIDATHRESRLALAGNLLVRMNQVEMAYREFRRCLEQHPEDIDALMGVASCERRLAHAHAAERRLRDLLRRELTSKQRIDIQLELGQVLLEKGEFAAAIELLADVVEREPVNSTAHHALGLAYAGRKQPERAVRCFERSRVLAEQYGRLGEITTELISHPANADLRWEAGQILMDQGLHYEGAAWMSTVLMFDPNHQKAHESLSQYYEAVRHDQRLAEHHRVRARRAANRELN